MTVDVLAVGAHPDDVELGVGGLLHSLVCDGFSVAILDLTRGELATRGSVEEREQEARDAAHILGVSRRENVGLPDGRVQNLPEQRLKVVPFIRAFQPRILLAPMRGDRHPDHEAAHYLVRDANFMAGMAKIETDQEPHRAGRVYFFAAHGGEGTPAMIADISDSFDAKLASIAAYKSQFHNPSYEGQDTYISSPEFWESLRTKAAYWGWRVGARFGEPLFTDEPVGIDVLPGLEMRL